MHGNDPPLQQQQQQEQQQRQQQQHQQQQQMFDDESEDEDEEVLPFSQTFSQISERINDILSQPCLELPPSDFEEYVPESPGFGQNLSIF